MTDKVYPRLELIGTDGDILGTIPMKRTADGGYTQKGSPETTTGTGWVDYGSLVDERGKRHMVHIDVGHVVAGGDLLDFNVEPLR